MIRILLLTGLVILVSGAMPARADDPASVIAARSSGIVETAVASCAGGAAIGYLVAAGSGAGGATVATFCGLSVAASVAGAASLWAWRGATGYLSAEQAR
jgi:hypothetical protein